MRNLRLNELKLISGGDSPSPYDFTDSFLAGMKGDPVPYGLNAMAIGLAGGSFGLALGAIVPLVPALSSHRLGFSVYTTLAGIGIGSLTGAVMSYSQYHAGANYAAALQIING